MKPRPTISMFASVARPRKTIQCHRNIHLRPTLSCHVWHDRSRITAGQEGDNWGPLGPCKRFASTSAHPSAKPTHGRPAALPPSKPVKTTTLTKQSRPHPPLPPAKRVPSQTSLVSPKPNDLVNPPPFTYAPDLDVPARQPSQSYISYLWKCGRTYLTFYKSGVSNVRQTAKHARSLRAQSTPLTRAEWQVVQRSRRDMLRLPAFGLIFLVCGEWTPLLVMYITPLIPEACRIPAQVGKQRAKVEERRHKRMRAVGAMEALDVNAQVGELSGQQLLAASARLGCHSVVWDWISVTPPRSWLARNVRKRFEYLRKDDELIGRDGGWQGLERREVERACIERGMDVLGKGEGDLRRALGEWFSGKKG